MQAWNSHIKKAHERYLDKWLGLYDYDEYKRWLFSGLIDILNKYVKWGKVLEIGCSKGYLIYLLNEKGYMSIGGDISLTALLKGVRINKVALDGENLPFKDGYFDAILSVHTLEHMPRPDKAIREIERALTKNGLFLAVTPDKCGLLTHLGSRLVEYTAMKNPYHVGLMSKRELTTILKETGFKNFTILPFHNGFLGAPFIQRSTKRPFIPFPISTYFFLPFLHHMLIIALK